MQINQDQNFNKGIFPFKDEPQTAVEMPYEEELQDNQTFRFNNQIKQCFQLQNTEIFIEKGTKFLCEDFQNPGTVLMISQNKITVYSQVNTFYYQFSKIHFQYKQTQIQFNREMRFFFQKLNVLVIQDKQKIYVIKNVHYQFGEQLAICGQVQLFQIDQGIKEIIQVSVAIQSKQTMLLIYGYKKYIRYQNVIYTVYFLKNKDNRKLILDSVENKPGLLLSQHKYLYPEINQENKLFKIFQICQHDKAYLQHIQAFKKDNVYNYYFCADKIVLISKIGGKFKLNLYKIILKIVNKKSQIDLILQNTFRLKDLLKNSKIQILTSSAGLSTVIYGGLNQKYNTVLQFFSSNNKELIYRKTFNKRLEYFITKKQVLIIDQGQLKRLNIKIESPRYQLKSNLDLKTLKKEEYSVKQFRLFKNIQITSLQLSLKVYKIFQDKLMFKNQNAIDHSENACVVCKYNYVIIISSDKTLVLTFEVYYFNESETELKSKKIQFDIQKQAFKEMKIQNIKFSDNSKVVLSMNSHKKKIKMPVAFNLKTQYLYVSLDQLYELKQQSCKRISSQKFYELDIDIQNNILFGLEINKLRALSLDNYQLIEKININNVSQFACLQKNILMIKQKKDLYVYNYHKSQKLFETHFQKYCFFDHYCRNSVIKTNSSNQVVQQRIFPVKQQKFHTFFDLFQILNLYAIKNSKLNKQFSDFQFVRKDLNMAKYYFNAAVLTGSQTILNQLLQMTTDLKTNILEDGIILDSDPLKFSIQKGRKKLMDKIIQQKNKHGLYDQLKFQAQSKTLNDYLLNFFKKADEKQLTCYGIKQFGDIGDSCIPINSDNPYYFEINKKTLNRINTSDESSEIELIKLGRPLNTTRGSKDSLNILQTVKSIYSPQLVNSNISIIADFYYNRNYWYFAIQTIVRVLLLSINIIAILTFSDELYIAGLVSLLYFILYQVMTLGNQACSFFNKAQNIVDLCLIIICLINHSMALSSNGQNVIVAHIAMFFLCLRLLFCSIIVSYFRIFLKLLLKMIESIIPFTSFLIFILFLFVLMGYIVPNPKKAYFGNQVIAAIEGVFLSVLDPSTEYLGTEDGQTDPNRIVMKWIVIYLRQIILVLFFLNGILVSTVTDSYSYQDQMQYLIEKENLDIAYQFQILFSKFEFLKFKQNWTHAFIKNSVSGDKQEKNESLTVAQFQSKFQQFKCALIKQSKKSKNLKLKHVMYLHHCICLENISVSAGSTFQSSIFFTEKAQIAGVIIGYSTYLVQYMNLNLTISQKNKEWQIIYQKSDIFKVETYGFDSMLILIEQLNFNESKVYSIKVTFLQNYQVKISKIPNFILQKGYLEAPVKQSNGYIQGLYLSSLNNYPNAIQFYKSKGNRQYKLKQKGQLVFRFKSYRNLMINKLIFNIKQNFSFNLRILFVEDNEYEKYCGFAKLYKQFNSSKQSFLSIQNVTLKEHSVYEIRLYSEGNLNFGCYEEQIESGIKIIQLIKDRHNIFGGLIPIQ